MSIGGYAGPVRPLGTFGGGDNGAIARPSNGKFGKGFPKVAGENGAAPGAAPSLEDVEVLPAASPPITAKNLQAGELVDVFHRYAQDPNGYFMVKHRSSGIMHPSVGVTDGWTSAKVSEAWNAENYKFEDYRTWVEIQWQHPLWYNRRGHKLDVSKASMITQRVTPEQIRQRNEPTEAQQQPKVTLLHVRWGGAQPVNPVTEGAGGWGQIGSTPSDNYINGWEDQVFQTLGPSYEIISVFFQNSEELGKVSPSLLRHLATGQSIGAFYFMWPIVFQDGHEFPAYVNRDLQFRLMVEMEATGIPTRFPHHSNLYRIFGSKEWTAQMCLHPLLRVPLTVQVPRQAVSLDPSKAATNALKALQNLSQSRSIFGEQCGLGQSKAGQIQKGVAKLGWSWEAMDVQSWKNKQELQTSLAQLAEQPGSNVDFIFCQEWVDFDVEIRHFLIEPDLSKPETLKAKKRIYTVFKSHEGGSFRNFDRYDRDQCLQQTFQNDDEGLTDAESQCDELILRWLQWLQGMTAELPTVCRFDILVKRLGNGKAAVTTGELTELGGCFLGWPEGPKTVFAAMLRSVQKDPADGHHTGQGDVCRADMNL